MNGRNTKRIWDKGISLVLTFGLICSGIGLIPAGEAKAAEPIAIDSAADLEKIGTDANYPLDGDYRLTSDIDMAGRNYADRRRRGRKGVFFRCKCFYRDI